MQTSSSGRVRLMPLSPIAAAPNGSRTITASLLPISAVLRGSKSGLFKFNVLSKAILERCGMRALLVYFGEGPFTEAIAAI
jgi:hypothetical protein